MARLKNNGKMGLIGYLKSLAETNSGQSSKAFAVLASTLISFLMGLTLCFAIGYDVYTDGVIDSDMQDMGILMLCMGGFVGGSSVSKILVLLYFYPFNFIGRYNSTSNFFQKYRYFYHSCFYLRLYISSLASSAKPLGIKPRQSK